MPRAHAPGEPFVLTRDIARAAQWAADLGPVLLLDDGRVHAPHHEGDGAWVGVDLACLCADQEEPCAHQALAAVRRDWPLALAPDVPEAALLRLRRQVAAHPEGQITHSLASPSVYRVLSRRPSQRTLDLLDPTLDDEGLLQILHSGRHHDAPVLALAAARRPGPVRDWLWTHYATSFDHLGLLARLIATEPSSHLAARLAALTPAGRREFAEAVGFDPTMLPRLAAAADPALRAALLSLLPHRHDRLVVIRAVGEANRRR